MSTPSIAQGSLQKSSSINGHSLRLIAGYGAALTLFVSLAAYGYDYYFLDATQRPYSPKHILLKPSGRFGINLGLLGLAMFCTIFLYALRKRWPWLSRLGSSKHWLDFHVLLGLSAPFVIAFHSSFKFQGFAGMAFWIMTAVALSGVIGRYLYAQIPRRVSATELTLKDLRELQEKHTSELANQRLVWKSDLAALFRGPTEAEIARMPIIAVLAHMIVLDIARPFRIARLRRRTLMPLATVLCLGGLLRTANIELENVIAVAREQASLAKRMAFLTRAQQVFHLWHVVHKPFSYSFAVLALVHISVVWLLGFI